MFVLVFDENVSRHIEAGLLRAGARVVALRVGAADAPPIGSSDEDLIVFAEERGAFIITNDRRTMATHLAQHFLRGGKTAGAFIIRPGTTTRRLVEELSAIVGASSPNEWRGFAVYAGGA